MTLFIRRRPGSLPERAAAPESVYLARRTLIRAGMAAAGLTAMTGVAGAQWLDPFRNRAPAAPPPADPTRDLYPATRNAAYAIDRPLTKEATVTGTVNYIEFSSNKTTAARLAQNKVLRPWTVTFDGLVEKEQTVDVDALIRAMTLEERVYRMRCVETWALAVPYTGFPMAQLLAFAKPLSSAKYVRFESFGATTGTAAKWAPGLKQSWYPWPYADGFTIAECANELAMVATGAYGKPLDRANGAPLRVMMPWKYGFKHTKAIVRVSFLDTRPKSLWEKLQGDEYGFWANVNPDVPHKRWSQANERDLGSGEERPTLLYNGYAEYVADLYKDLKGEQLFM